MASRPGFRGNVTSPFLRHQFVEDSDELVVTLRDRAASLCMQADRETLYKVLELLKKPDKPEIRRSVSQPVLEESSSSAMLRELAGAPSAVKLGLDLGGTLTKLVIASPHDVSIARADERLRLRVTIDGLRMSLHFAATSTSELEEILQKLNGKRVEHRTREIVAAGGGAHKLKGDFRQALGIELTPFREMQSIVDGLLLLHELQVTDEVYRVAEDRMEAASTWPHPLLPCLLVNVGSGVSCLLVTREGYARIGGTAIGGATFLGLARALTSASTYNDAIKLASAGEAHKVDTLVGDIYGQAGCVDLGLPPNLTAASFGKLSRRDVSSFSEADVCRALLEMVAQSCCVLARAHANQLGCKDRVFFSGGFVDRNPLARATIANSLRSLGGQAHFLRHSDFLGALGATAKCLPRLGPKQIVKPLPHHHSFSRYPHDAP